MKLDLVLEGPYGKMWELSMRYHKLPPEYEMEIASAARNYANFISNMAGGAAGEDREYSVKFVCHADEGEPKEAKRAPDDLLKSSGEAENLLYSQAVEIQNAGIQLLSRLLESAYMEIKSGQRK